MKDRLEKLLIKYWEGETSLEEEKELKNLVSLSDQHLEEKEFFLGTKTVSEQEPILFPMPGSYSPIISKWMKIAAVLVFFLISTTVIYKMEAQRAEKEAYEQVMQAFALIQTNMRKGTESLELMSDFKYLSTTQEIFNIKEHRE
jgi:L-2-hydroxyglutarate oxidase LhgO